MSKRFWTGMAHRSNIKPNDKLMVGNIDNGEPEYINFEELPSTPGPKGDNGADGRTVLYGTMPPTTQGSNGDFYINTSTWNIYGPKSDGIWNDPVSMQGPKGDPSGDGWGGLAIADIPVNDGYYFASENGTYVNAGGLVVDLNQGITTIIKKGNIFSKVVAPIDFSGYLAQAIDPENVTLGVTGKAVHDWLKENQVVLKNKVEDGDMKDFSKWSATTASIALVSDGISLTASATVNPKIFKYLNDIVVTGDEYFFLVADITNIKSASLNYTATIANGANTAFSFSGSISNGRSTVAIQLSRESFTYMGTGSFYFNTFNSTEVSYIIHSILLVDGKDIERFTENNLKSIYEKAGFFKELRETALSVLLDEYALKSEINSLTSEVDNIVNSLPQQDTYINLVGDGQMTDLTKWAGTTAEQVSDGIRVSGSGTLLRSNAYYNVMNTDEIEIFIEVESSSSTVISASLYNGNYTHDSTNIILGQGNIKKSITLIKGTGAVTSVRLYLNRVSGSGEITFRSILMLKNQPSGILKNLYENIGFFSVFGISKYANIALNSPSLEDFDGLDQRMGALEVNDRVIIRAYASGTSTEQEELNGIFRGVKGNLNSIQRAILSIPSDTIKKHEIRCYGEFTATTFAEMSATDTVNNKYKSFISLTGKRNILIKGVGIKKTVISCILPNTGVDDYSNYQVVTMDCINCGLENLQIIGQNLRYPVHTDTTGAINSNLNSKMKFRNVHFWHKGNSGDALSQWSATTAYGVGISKGMTMIFDSCRFTSTSNTPFGGHDGYGEEYAKMSLRYCTFDKVYPESLPSMQWNVFGNDSSNWDLELIGNNFGNNRIKFNKGANNSFLYVTVSGYGNSKFIYDSNYTDNSFVHLSDVTLNIINKSGPIQKYSAVTNKGTLSSGDIFAIAIDASNIDETFRAVKNTLLKLSDLPVKIGEVLSNGDYVSSDNGEIIKSSIFKKSRVVEINNILYLEI